MANVLFKRGTQASLEALMAFNDNATTSNRKGVEGTFYLTTDTNRLFVGNSDKNIVPVNEGIIIVNTISDLPTIPSGDTDTAKAERAKLQGRFYYAKTPNILCIASGNTWVQLNPNTNTKLSSLADTVTISGNTVTVETKVTDTDNDHKEDSFTITGANGIKLTSSGKAITVTGPTLKTGSAITTGKGSVPIKLVANTGTDNAEVAHSTITIQGKANGNVTVSSSGANVIDIDSKDTKVSSTNILTGTYNGQTKTNTNGFTIDVIDSDSASHRSSIDPTIKLGDNTEAYHFVSGEASLPVYTKSEIDTKLKKLDGMTYKGVVGNTTTPSLPTANVSRGDTYMAFQNMASPAAKKGDLIIATGTEGNDGFLSTITWEVVPSGDDAAKDTTYAGTAGTNKFTIKDSDNKTIMDLNFAAGTAMTVSGSKTSGTSQTITVTHGTVNNDLSTLKSTGTAVTQLSHGSIKPKVITKVAVNKEGHVTGYEETELTIVDTVASVSEFKHSGSAANNIATITTGLKTVDANNAIVSDKSATLKLASNTMSVTSSTASNVPTVTIDMVWGTF